MDNTESPSPSDEEIAAAALMQNAQPAPTDPVLIDMQRMQVMLYAAEERISALEYRINALMPLLNKARSYFDGVLRGRVIHRG